MSSATIALVTGANKGIGYEIAAGLGALGWTAGVGARDEARRDDAVATLRAAGADAFGVPLDVTDDAGVAAAVAVLKDAGGLDVLVNNARTTGGIPQDPTTVDLVTMRAAGDQRDRRRPRHQRTAAAAAPAPADGVGPGLRQRAPSTARSGPTRPSSRRWPRVRFGRSASATSCPTTSPGWPRPPR